MMYIYIFDQHKRPTFGHIMKDSTFGPNETMCEIETHALLRQQQVDSGFTTRTGNTLRKRKNGSYVELCEDCQTRYKKAMAEKMPWLKGWA